MGINKQLHQRQQDFVDPLQTLLQNDEPEICNEREAAVAAIELLRIQDIEETVKFWTKDVLNCLAVRRKFLQPMKKALDIWDSEDHQETSLTVLSTVEKDLLHELQRQFVFVPTDKSPQTIAMVCRHFYISRLNDQKLLMTPISSDEIDARKQAVATAAAPYHQLVDGNHKM